MSDVEITKVDVYKIKLEPNILGFAKVTFNECFVVDGIKILNSAKGIFIGMPSRKNKEGEYQDICFPITKEFRNKLKNEILEKYNDSPGKDSRKKREENDDDPF